jgi:hypothetical protein
MEWMKDEKNEVTDNFDPTLENIVKWDNSK